MEADREERGGALEQWIFGLTCFVSYFIDLRESNAGRNLSIE